MHWFHQVGDMGWLVVFWAANFLVLLGGSWLLTTRARRSRRRAHTSPGTGPHEVSSPKPSA